MDAPTPAAADRPPGKAPFQFRLKHLLAAPVVLAVFFALGAWLGAGESLVGLLLVLLVWVAAGLCFRYTRPLAVVTAIALVPLLGIVLLGTPRVAVERPGGPRCPNNLKLIGLALHNYHDQHGCFPPPFLADDQDRPIHSWRVLLLPYLEQEVVYEQYRFDEPWDGPNNGKLAELAIPAFTCPDARGETSTMTSYLAVIGPETAWPGANQSTVLADCLDGTANTLLVVEVADSGIHWMEPRDLHVLQMAPAVNPKAGQGISGPHRRGAWVCMADGSVRFLPESISREELEALLTIAGAEPVDPDNLDR